MAVQGTSRSYFCHDSNIFKIDQRGRGRKEERDGGGREIGERQGERGGERKREGEGRVIWRER